jgi:hypothetical protein
MNIDNMTDDSPEYLLLKEATIRALRAKGGSYAVVALFMEENLSEVYRQVLTRTREEGLAPKHFITGWVESIGAISGQILAICAASDDTAKHALAAMGHQFMTSTADSYHNHKGKFGGRDSDTEH